MSTTSVVLSHLLFSFFYLHYNELCPEPPPPPTPTHHHVRDNTPKTAVNICNCAPYNGADLLGWQQPH